MFPQKCRIQEISIKYTSHTLVNLCQKKKKQHESNIYVLPASINGITIPIGARNMWAIVKDKWQKCVLGAQGAFILWHQKWMRSFFFFYRNNYNMLLIPHLEPFSPRSPTWLRSCIAGVRAMNCHYLNHLGMTHWTNLLYFKS